jgi:hypothetical protein
VNHYGHEHIEITDSIFRDQRFAIQHLDTHAQYQPATMRQDR